MPAVMPRLQIPIASERRSRGKYDAINDQADGESVPSPMPTPKRYSLDRRDQQRKQQPVDERHGIRKHEYGDHVPRMRRCFHEKLLQVVEIRRKNDRLPALQIQHVSPRRSTAQFPMGCAHRCRARSARAGVRAGHPRLSPGPPAGARVAAAVRAVPRRESWSERAPQDMRGPSRDGGS